ncbi:hypothetical protein N7507_005805 [Penicillium longicatenatum]|nr:hypothetical protein N7507_005805 [Penicillium longicatenatum]
MSGFMKKFKKKRRLSTELHDRWGDPAISYPNEGSWNQWNQTSGFVANASMPIEAPRRLQPDDSRNYGRPSVPPLQHQGWNNFNPHIHAHTPPDSKHDGSNFPSGYFDASIRRRPEKALRAQYQGLGIDGPRHDIQEDIRDEENDSICDESCDEEDGERDTMGDPRELMYRGHATGDIPRVGRDECGSYDRAAKSPALSITSRMRRVSTQSSATQASSVAGSSRRTSYTAASSVSAPSLPDTPRFASHAMHSAHAEKRPPVPRPKTRDPEPTPTQHEMVPSYDELYG